jgi:hypothetical protein
MKIIVLDSNIWIRELALMSSLGCAFSYYVMKKDVKIGLPEVIELEVKNRFRNSLIEKKNTIEKEYRSMLAILGRMKELVMPSDEEIHQRAEQIFDSHEKRIIRVPFDIAGAKSSFEKIINNLPPNSEKNQQFKDGVIWANCLELAEKGDVCLITQDKAFFKGNQRDQGLAQNLLKEAKNAKSTISIFGELSKLLNEIKSDPNIDKKRLVKLIEAEVYLNVEEISDKHDFEVIGIAGSQFKLYATTEPTEISVQSVLTYDLEDRIKAGRSEGIVESKAQFIVNVTDYSTREFRNNGENIAYVDENGETKRNKYPCRISLYQHQEKRQS